MDDTNTRKGQEGREMGGKVKIQSLKEEEPDEKKGNKPVKDNTEC